MTYPLPVNWTPTSTVTAANLNNISALVNSLWLLMAAFPMMPTAHVATVGTETFTIVGGSVTVIAGLSVDGVTVSTTGAANGLGDYILVKDAPATSGVGSPGSTQPPNGLYQVTSTAGGNIAVQRAAQMTTGAQAATPAGMLIGVMAGTANAGNAWWVSSPNNTAAFTYGTTAIGFTQALIQPLGVQTISNKRVVKRVGSTPSSANPAINTDNFDVYKLTAQAVPIPVWTITGTPNDRDEFTLCITDNGTQQSLGGWSWAISSGAAFLPTATTPGKTMTLKFVYDSGRTKWVLMAVDVNGY